MSFDTSCGSGACGCASSRADSLQVIHSAVPLARVNGVALHAEDEVLETELLRQRAYTELLRQQAQREGLLAQTDLPSDGGAISAEAAQAIELLLEREVQVPEPSDEACRRYHAAHPMFDDERVRLRHILFAVTQGVDVRALRRRAEAMLLDLRCADEEGEKFAEAAREWSNCPSGKEGGNLGWLSRGECAPEFARDVFSTSEVGVLARLVHSRFGLHVVQVLERKLGRPIEYEQARVAVAQKLRQKTWVNAFRQYLQLLTGAAVVEGVVLDAADTPLVQ